MMNTTTSMIADSIHDNRLLQFASRSEEIILPCLLLIGTTCNTLTFVVMRRGRMRYSSSCFYMAALAIADTFVLWIGCLNRWLELLDKQRPILACNLCCKLGTFAFFFFADCSVWITVAMTFERYIAVSRPLRASQVCTVKRARYMLVLVLTIFFLVNAHFLWTFHLSPTEYHCSPVDDQSLFIKYFTWIDSFKYSFCPFTLLITLNILIIQSLLNARNNNKLLQQQQTSAIIRGNNSQTTTTTNSYSISFSSTSTTTNNNTNSTSTLLSKNGIIRAYHQPQHTSTKALAYRRVNRRLTTMLLTVSFAFCICSMPISIMQLIDALYSNIEQRSTTMATGIAVGKIIAEISQYLNHSSNFFLYAFTGRIFRHELRRLFTCKRIFFFSSSSTSSSQRLTQRAKKLMLIGSPSQGVHEHFYSHGKRHTRILVAPKRLSAPFSATPLMTSAASENCTYRPSMCSAYSTSEMPLTQHYLRVRRHSTMSDDDQDETFLSCNRHQPVDARISTTTQTTSIVQLEPSSPTIRQKAALVSFVETIKNQQNDQMTPLLNSSMQKSTTTIKTIKPYGLTDMTPNT